MTPVITMIHSTMSDVKHERMGKDGTGWSTHVARDDDDKGPASVARDVRACLSEKLNELRKVPHR